MRYAVFHHNNSIPYAASGKRTVYYTVSLCRCQRSVLAMALLLAFGRTKNEIVFSPAITAIIWREVNNDPK